jgi:hypothetical protein
MESLLAGNAAYHEYAQSLAFEHFVNLALRLPLEGSGFLVQLTPQSLEESTDSQKGVDLLIRDEAKLVYLGIDVKLRRGRSRLQRDGFGWNTRLLSPYIYLSLGDFVANTREGTQISVRQWLHQFAIPHINSTGKIPHWDQFRGYLLARIERSLNGYVEKVREYEEFDNLMGIPSTNESLEILIEKLAVMHCLFVELRQQVSSIC